MALRITSTPKEGQSPPGKSDTPKVKISGKISLKNGGSFAMKTTKFTEELIAFSLHQVETGTKVADL